MWIVLALAALGILAVLALLTGGRRPEQRDDVDPLFTAGIAIAGASAALIATLGTAMIPMLLIGLAAVVVGGRRNRTHRPPR